MNKQENLLNIHLFDLEFTNPVWTASGTFGYGEEYSQLFDLSVPGALVTKAITLYPREGNPPPRVVETPSGMLNAIGLANVGVDGFIREKMPFLRQTGTRIIVNVAGATLDEYGEVVSKLSDVDGIAALEINISCPNVKEGGMMFGSSPSQAAAVTNRVRKSTHLPVILKLSPNVTDIVAIARACENEGAHGISLINTLLGMAVDVKSRKPILANVTGGLSGPAIRPIALRMVFDVARAVKIPVIGIGGISSVSDVLEFLIAGASVVQVGTAIFSQPLIHQQIIEDLQYYFLHENIPSVNDLIGSIEV